MTAPLRDIRMPPKKYFLYLDDKAVGPYTLVEVGGLIVDGQFTSKHFVCPVGGKEWVPADQVEELVPLFHEKPPQKEDIPVVLKERFKNAKLDVPVEFEVKRLKIGDDEKLDWEKCRMDDTSKATDEEMGLSFDPEASILKLKPSKSGDFTIIFSRGTKYRLEYRLTVIAKPRKLPDYIEEHRDSRMTKVGERVLKGEESPAHLHSSATERLSGPSLPAVEQVSATKPQILELNFIFNNPFRVLGVPVTSKTRDIEKALSKASAFASVGKAYTTPSDIPLLFASELSTDSVQLAKAKLEQAQSRLHAALFWFWEGNGIDEMACSAIRAGNPERALSLWGEVCLKKHISESNFSCFRNLALYLLANAESDDGAVDKKKLRESLILSGDFLSSPFLKEYVRVGLNDERKSVDTDEVCKYYANAVAKALDKALNKKVLTLKQFIQLFRRFPASTRHDVVSKFSTTPTRQIEKILERECNNIDNQPTRGLEIAELIIKSSADELNILSQLFEKDDYQLDNLRISIGAALHGCCTIYFNHYLENNNPQGVQVAQCLQLLKKAYRFCSKGTEGRNIAESIEFLESWNPNASQPSSGCYVATMVYGSANCPEVVALRHFRDKVLCRTKIGRHFINLYYKYSPGFVEEFRDSPLINKAIRVCLNIFLKILR
jgi:hypothetical protein